MDFGEAYRGFVAKMDLISDYAIEMFWLIRWQTHSVVNYSSVLSI
jgi:hypothetical protein